MNHSVKSNAHKDTTTSDDIDGRTKSTILEHDNQHEDLDSTISRESDPGHNPGTRTKSISSFQSDRLRLPRNSIQYTSGEEGIVRSLNSLRSATTKSDTKDKDTPTPGEIGYPTTTLSGSSHGRANVLSSNCETEDIDRNIDNIFNFSSMNDSFDSVDSELKRLETVSTTTDVCNEIYDKATTNSGETLEYHPSSGYTLPFISGEPREPYSSPAIDYHPVQLPDTDTLRMSTGINNAVHPSNVVAMSDGDSVFAYNTSPSLLRPLSSPSLLRPLSSAAMSPVRYLSPYEAAPSEQITCSPSHDDVIVHDRTRDVITETCFSDLMGVDRAKEQPIEKEYMTTSSSVSKNNSNILKPTIHESQIYSITKIPEFQQISHISPIQNIPEFHKNIIKLPNYPEQNIVETENVVKEIKPLIRNEKMYKPKISPIPIIPKFDKNLNKMCSNMNIPITENSKINISEKCSSQLLGNLKKETQKGNDTREFNKQLFRETIISPLQNIPKFTEKLPKEQLKYINKIDTKEEKCEISNSVVYEIEPLSFDTISNKEHISRNDKYDIIHTPKEIFDAFPRSFVEEHSDKNFRNKTSEININDKNDLETITSKTYIFKQNSPENMSPLPTLLHTNKMSSDNFSVENKCDYFGEKLNVISKNSNITFLNRNSKILSMPSTPILANIDSLIMHNNNEIRRSSYPNSINKSSHNIIHNYNTLEYNKVTRNVTNKIPLDKKLSFKDKKCRLNLKIFIPPKVKFDSINSNISEKTNFSLNKRSPTPYPRSNSTINNIISNTSTSDVNLDIHSGELEKGNPHNDDFYNATNNERVSICTPPNLDDVMEISNEDDSSGVNDSSINKNTPHHMLRSRSVPCSVHNFISISNRSLLDNSRNLNNSIHSEVIYPKQSNNLRRHDSLTKEASELLRLSPNSGEKKNIENGIETESTIHKRHHSHVSSDPHSISHELHTIKRHNIHNNPLKRMTICSRRKKNGSSLKRRNTIEHITNYDYFKKNVLEDNISTSSNTPQVVERNRVSDMVRKIHDDSTKETLTYQKHKVPSSSNEKGVVKKGVVKKIEALESARLPFAKSNDTPQKVKFTEDSSYLKVTTADALRTISDEFNFGDYSTDSEESSRTFTDESVSGRVEVPSMQQVGKLVRSKSCVASMPPKKTKSRIRSLRRSLSNIPFVEQFKPRNSFLSKEREAYLSRKEKIKLKRKMSIGEILKAKANLKKPSYIDDKGKQKNTDNNNTVIDAAYKLTTFRKAQTSTSSEHHHHLKVNKIN